MRPKRERQRRFRPPRREHLRRGIFVLPSLFTVGNMLCGFASVLHAIHGRLELAGWLILLAGLLDGLDGRIARLTGSTSEFGKEYDSLADVVSFGVAPAILAYEWGLQGMGRLGWLVTFLFVVAGSVRLARFNVGAAVADRRFFTGLPIPAGAGAVTLMVLLDSDPVFDRRLSLVVWAFVLLVSVLMVSTIPYQSLKQVNLRRRWPARTFFVIALVVAAIAFWKLWALAALCATYLLSGPVEYVSRKLLRRPVVPPAPSAPPSLEVKSAASDTDSP